MQIDLKYLKEQGLTPDYYVALRLLKEQRYEELDIFGDIIDLVIGELIVNNYIICISNSYADRSKLLLTKKAQDLFKTNLSGFEKLFNNYPHKVPNGAGGSRILRPINLDSKVAINCKSLYKGLIKGKPELEDNIYQSLLTMLEIEKNKLQFLVEFERWLRRGDYEKYFDLEAEKELEEKRL